MTQSPDVVVIGGGVVGAACARELARAGRRVTLLERGARGGEAWRAAAGMLAPQIEARQDDLLFDFALAGRERYRALQGELLGTTGIDIGVWYGGIARLAADEDDATVLRQRVAWQRQAGQMVDWLDPDEVRARWPWTGPAAGALWAPHEGGLEPDRLVEALRRDAVAAGAVLVADEARLVETAHGRVTAVAGRERYPCDAVVVAAGAWSPLVAGLGRPLPVAPVRGQMAALPWPADLPRAIVYHRDCYVVHRAGEAIVGSTMEHAGFDAEVTSAGLERLLEAAGRIAPVFRGVPPLRTWAGLRPITADGLPLLGAEPRCGGLWYATGHGRNGILLAGISGLVLRQLMDGEPPAVEGWRAMAPERCFAW
ncbi:MAG: glycine oxidase ThiO [Gemmatimonadales bacterium]|nr:glycine oxidase ThiO [Gemmatimonadales bacterium]